MHARIAVIQALKRNDVPPPLRESGKQSLRKARAEERPMTVFVYVNTSNQVGDVDHITVFANGDAWRNGSRRTIPRASTPGRWKRRV
jgi:hypothetical protein